MQWDGRAPKVGDKAAELALLDAAGKPTTFAAVARGKPLVILIVAGFEDPDLQLLRAYRNDTLALWRAGAAICAIAPLAPAELRYARSERGLAFPLLADPDGEALASWGMLHRSGVFLLDGDGIVKQRSSGPAATPDSILSLLRRGGARRTRPGLRERAVRIVHGVQHAFRTLRPAR